MDYIQRSQEVFDQEICELKKVSKRIGNEINEIVDLIYNCKGKVIVTGIGKTGLIGKKIAASLSSTGTLSIFMNSTDALHGDLGMARKDDIVIAISNSGSSTEILNILPPLRKIGTSIIAITGNLESRLAKEADYVLDVSVEREACPLNLAPTSSTTATLVMGDALSICLMEKRGFKTEDYAIFHPGGALGRRLLTHVEDLMSKEIPIVYETDNFKDVIYVISDRRKGMTMVENSEGQMTGIITDGDIRRAIQNYDDVISKQAIDFMTHGFKKIRENAQINDALEMMTANKITTLAVTKTKESSKIIGLITVHDIIDFDK
jgi:arabinose-5-phosphate isomerase